MIECHGDCRILANLHDISIEPFKPPYAGIYIILEFQEFSVVQGKKRIFRHHHHRLLLKFLQ